MSDRKAWQHHDSRHGKQPKGDTTARGYGWAWQQLRARILKRDGYLCRDCRTEGRVTLATDVDHITPKAKGGTDEDDNLQSLCADHHKAKTARDEGRRVRRAIGSDGYPLP